MRIFEIDQKIIQKAAPVKAQIESGLHSLITPDQSPISITTHFASRIIERSIDPNTPVDMLSRAFEKFAPSLRKLGHRNRVVIRDKTGMGIVLSRTLEPANGWVLITIDPKLNNSENPVPELKI